KQDPKKIANTLGVKILAQGTAQSAGDRLSITISMTDVSQNKELLKKEFPGTKKDLLTLEDQIFTSLANALMIHQSNEERNHTMSRPTDNVDAYDLYLRGRNFMRGRTVANVDLALNAFNDAIARDPRFALAYTGVADASLIKFDLTKDSKLTEQALAAALQARVLNENAPE